MVPRGVGRPPRRQVHDVEKGETRSPGENRLEWRRASREEMLTRSVRDAWVWAASFSGTAASTATGSRAVMASGPSVPDSCRMSSKNVNKTKKLVVFQQYPSRGKISHLLPRLGPASTPQVRRLHTAQTSRRCARGTISNAMGMHVTRTMDSVSLAFERGLQARSPQGGELTNRVTISLTLVRRSKNR